VVTAGTQVFLFGAVDMTIMGNVGIRGGAVMTEECAVVGRGGITRDIGMVGDAILAQAGQDAHEQHNNDR
jgi:hypothetical protein